MSCKRIEGKLVAFMDGRASDADRRVVESHLAECTGCKARVEGFSGVWAMLSEVPVVEPSAAFEARLRARMAAEPQRVGFWAGLAELMPSRRLALAGTLLVIFSLWQASRPVAVNDTATVPASSDSEFRMIQDLPVLENYDVLTSLDALSQPTGQGQSSPERN
jgi:anti-sigma factor RsiW